MGFVQGVHRDQPVMFPESLDEYIGDENPVRFIDAFVDSPEEVTNEGNDKQQLSSMAIRAKEVLEVESLEVVADKGYYSGTEIKECVDAEIVPFIPETDSSSNSRAGLYGKQDFRYDAESDCYWCPAGKALPFSYQTTSNGQKVRVYLAKGCNQCALKAKCHRNKFGRRIKRWVHEAMLEEMARRVRAEPDKVKQRKSIVEHPFGTIKRDGINSAIAKSTALLPGLFAQSRAQETMMRVAGEGAAGTNLSTRRHWEHDKASRKKLYARE